MESTIKKRPSFWSSSLRLALKFFAGQFILETGKEKSQGIKANNVVFILEEDWIVSSLSPLYMLLNHWYGHRGLKYNNVSFIN